MSARALGLRALFLVVLMPGLLPALAGAGVTLPFSIAQINSTNSRAGEIANWDLILEPNIQGNCLDYSLPITIEVDLDGNPAPSRPGFHPAGATFIASGPSGVSGLPGGSVSGTWTGNPQSGVQLFITYNATDFWCPIFADTFHLTGIVNATTGGVNLVHVQAYNTNGLLAAPKDATVNLTGTTVAGYLIRTNDSPPVPFPIETAGTPFGIRVDAVDRYGNTSDTSVAVSVHDSTHTYPAHQISLSSGFGSLVGVAVTKSGTDYFLATDGVHSGISNPFTVQAAALQKFGFHPLPATIVAHDPFAATVEAQDLFGNVVLSYAGVPSAVDLTQTLTPATLPFTAGAFNGSFNIATPFQQDVITVSDGTLGISGHTPAFNVLAQSLAGFQVSVPVGPLTAGHAFPIVVRALDASGFVVPTFSGVSVQLSDSTGTLVPATSGLFTQGVWSGSGFVTSARLGDRITASDGQGHTGLSSAFDVLHGPYARLRLSGYPDSVEKGAPFPLTVAVVDSFNNVATGLAQAAALSDRKHKIAPTVTGSLVSGSWTGTVSVTDTTANDTITAVAAIPLVTMIGKTGPIQVVPATVRSFAVGILLSQAPVAGRLFPLGVLALDAQGQVVPEFNGTVLLADSSGTISPTVTPAFTSGVLSTSVRVTHSGSDVITASDGAGHSGRSPLFAVVPGPLGAFTVGLPQGALTARTPFSVTLTAQDSFANVVPTFPGPAAISDLSGTLAPSLAGPFNSGIWTGSVTVGRGFAADRIAVSANGVSDTSAAFDVNAAAPQILAAVPNSLPPGTQGTVAVIGHFFDPDAALSVTPDVTVSDLVRVSEDTLRATFQVAQGAPEGPRHVTVSQFGAQASADTVFSVLGFLPTVLRLSRPVLARTAQVTELVFGEHFDSTSAVSMGGFGVTVGVARFVSSETLSVDVQLDDVVPLGPRDVSATNRRGPGLAASLLTVVERPQIDSLVPKAAGTGDTVLVYGRSFETDSLEAWRVGLGARAPIPGNVSGGTLASFVMPSVALNPSESLYVHSYGAVSPPFEFSTLAPVRGDVNGDGRVDIADVALVVSQILGDKSYTGRALFAADCDGSGTVNVLDVLCAVDLSISAAYALLALPGLPVQGTVVWNPVTRELNPPQGARAVLWRARGEFQEGASSQAAQSGGAWRAAQGYVVGVSGLLNGRALQLPAGVNALLDLIWADAQGQLRRAHLAAPAAPLSFQVLGNPQRERLWFSIPAHAAPAVLELYHADGRRVAARTLSREESGAVSWRPAAPLPAGLYVARFRSAETHATAKLLYFP